MAEVTVDTLKIQVEYNLGSKNIANSINNISKALDKLGASNSNLNLTKTINALTKLSQIKLSKVSKSLMDIKSALQQVISVPKEELLKFEQKDIEKMQKATIGGGKNVASMLNQTYPTPLMLPEKSSYESMQNALSQATIKAQELAEKTKQIKLTYLKESIEKLQPTLMVLSSKLNTLQEKLKSNFDNIPEKQRETLKNMLLTYTQQYEDITTKLNGIDVNSNDWQKRLYATKVEISNLTSNVTKATQAVNGFKSSTKQTSDTLQEVEKTTHKATSKFSRLFASLKRIAFYRAIRRALQLIVQAIKEGIQNIAIFDSQFNDSMSQLKSSLLYLKNSLGSLLAPLIQMLTPIVTKFVDLISVGIGKLAEMFAALNGQTTFTRATKTVEDYAKSLDKAKKATIGFDEINVFGNNETSITDMFETAQVGEEAKSFANTLNRIKNVLVQVGTRVYDIVKDILPIVLDIVETIVEVLAPVLEALEPIIEIVLDLVKDLVPVVQQIWEILKPIVQVLIQSLADRIEELAPYIDAIAQIIKNVIYTHLEMSKPILELFSNIISGIKTFIDNIKNSLVYSISPLSKDLTDDVLEMCDGLFTMENIIKTITDILIAPVQMINTLIQGINTLAEVTKSGNLGNALKSSITGNYDWTMTLGQEDHVSALLRQYGLDSSTSLPVSSNTSLDTESKEEKSALESFGDLVIQIVQQDGTVKSESIIREFLRKNRRDGKTVIPVFAN